MSDQENPSFAEFAAENPHAPPGYALLSLVLGVHAGVALSSLRTLSRRIVTPELLADVAIVRAIFARLDRRTWPGED